jgi:hypothetical protein
MCSQILLKTFRAVTNEKYKDDYNNVLRMIMFFIRYSLECLHGDSPCTL